MSEQTQEQHEAVMNDLYDRLQKKDHELKKVTAERAVLIRDTEELTKENDRLKELLETKQLALRAAYDALAVRNAITDTFVEFLWSIRHKTLSTARAIRKKAAAIENAYADFVDDRVKAIKELEE